MAEVAVVRVSHGVKTPPSVETKMSNDPIPEPPTSSLPDQFSEKLLVLIVLANAPTLLVGVPASMVLSASLVGSVPFEASCGST